MTYGFLDILGEVQRLEIVDQDGSLCLGDIALCECEHCMCGGQCHIVVFALTSFLTKFEFFLTDPSSFRRSSPEGRSLFALVFFSLASRLVSAFAFASLNNS